MSDDREKMLTDHRRPDGSDDATVSAVGSVSEALEWVERARGHLYTFHQLMGHADLQFGSAADELRDAGHGRAADALEREVIGRNVIEGRWTFQMVEDFDDGYWTTAREHERRIRDDLMDGRRHVFEAEMKEDRRTHGKRGHEATP
ncbi:hypothetical protein HQ325_02095 [Rhodococcus sp. BP-349]|uniref:hypothetical protein n=1 Tax=unclassified Rhodococcus (in: high G+C Gram-positive bacteria) TaxID=192944 RepID=UPI001C9AD5FE|nr:MULTISPECIES: hypothetical protein [unclassified Rhodococcus (in: high G+C Gram-positive bacteria)]MBY6537453.1 hypothetical protein [Rhodococcus sp. BP-363]MBY6541790.1 hypothetical protein [Rhodococcus sp. BP-369]MBY6561020.1 hypothetical protein [Rhodococcus sp. BP-370]MBY6575312.1 hypothetical protein [Rhodococcus sp. BP-364]MBY6584613.1 hypothetical protein [Rhodococcus sp. BP-358]